MGILGADKDFERQLKDDFLTEASELLGETESLFLQLEKDPSNTAMIDKIFRIVHTVKGSGAVAGFKSLTAFAHVFETLLNKIRNGELPATGSMVDLLLNGTDVLQAAIASLRQDHDALISAPEVEAKIEAAISAAKADSPKTTPPLPSLQKKNQSGDAGQIASARKSRILIVDDEPSVLTVIADILSAEPYDLITAASGQEALAALKGEPTIDLMITDQRMPDLDGAQVIEKMHQSGVRVPVIVVSGATDRHDAIKFIKLGVHDFFEKPIREEKLILAVANALRMRAMEETMTQLSKLSVRSYMTFRKILEVLENENLSASSHPSIQRYSEFLEQMGAIINRSLSTK